MFQRYTWSKTCSLRMSLMIIDHVNTEKIASLQYWLSERNTLLPSHSCTVGQHKIALKCLVFRLSSYHFQTDLPRRVVPRRSSVPTSTTHMGHYDRLSLIPRQGSTYHQEFHLHCWVIIRKAWILSTLQQSTLLKIRRHIGIFLFPWRKFSPAVLNCLENGCYRLIVYLYQSTCMDDK